MPRALRRAGTAWPNNSPCLCALSRLQVLKQKSSTPRSVLRRPPPPPNRLTIMSKLTYNEGRPRAGKPLVWLRRGVKTPPLSRLARIELGYRLRLLQEGVPLGMPHCRPMSAVGKRCFELRVRDGGINWRLVFRIDEDAIVIAGLFRKTSRAATDRLVEVSRGRLSRYDRAAEG